MWMVYYSEMMQIERGRIIHLAEAEMRKRFISIICTSVCAGMLLCACSSNADENVFTGDTTEKPAYQAKLNAISPAAYSSVEGLELEPGTYISVIGKEEDSAYWNQIRAGVEQAAEDLNEALGYSGSDQIKVLYNAPADEEDMNEQVNILDEELARYPDVIAIASIDEAASEVQFDLAAGNDIPVVAFDSGNAYQGIQCTCKTDSSAAAAEGAAKLCEAIGGSGEVALIVHDSVSESAREREEAFKEALSAEYPGAAVVETIYMDDLEEIKKSAAAEQFGVSLEEIQAEQPAEGTEQGEEPTGDSSAVMEEINAAAEKISDEDAVAYCLKKHPELKGCFGTNVDATQLALKAIGSLEDTDDVVLMGFDAGKEQLEALESGEIDGLVVQNPFGIGYAAVIASARTVLEIGNEAQVNTGYIWADQENLEEEAVQAMLYE